MGAASVDMLFIVKSAGEQRAYLKFQVLARCEQLFGVAGESGEIHGPER